MTKYKVLPVVICLAVLLALASGAARAADTDNPHQRMARALATWNANGDPRELLQVYRVWKLTDALGLSDEEMAGFVAKLKGLDDKRAEVEAKNREAMDQMASLVDKRDASDEELTRALANLEAVRKDGMDQLMKMRQEVLSSLSARQRCQYIIFESKFRQDVRQLVAQVRERRMERKEGWRDSLRRRLGARGGSDYH